MERVILFTLVICKFGQQDFIKPRAKDVIGEWVISSPWERTGQKREVLRFLEDGRILGGTESSTWKISGSKIFIGKSGFEFGLSTDRTSLTTNLCDFYSYTRKVTADILDNIEGVWSTKANAEPGPPDASTILVDQVWNRSAIRLHPDSVSVRLVTGKWVKLFPQNNFSQYIEAKPGKTLLTRLPDGPLDKAILGRWKCTDSRNPSNAKDLVFRSDGTYSYDGYQGTWSVSGKTVVVSNINGSILQFDAPIRHGIEMHTSTAEGIVLNRSL